MDGPRSAVAEVLGLVSAHWCVTLVSGLVLVLWWVGRKLRGPGASAISLVGGAMSWPTGGRGWGPGDPGVGVPAHWWMRLVLRLEWALWWVGPGPGANKLEGEFENVTCQHQIVPPGRTISPKWLPLASIFPE